VNPDTEILTSQPSRILLVDDEPLLLKSCKALLEMSGFVVTTASDGIETLEFLTQRPEDFDLLLLDLNMPGMNGIEVMKTLKANPADISVVVLSGESDFDSVSRAFQLGTYDYVRKPYGIEGLLNTLKNALQRREVEHRVFQLGKKLERSERLHRFMIESSPDIIFIVDKDGCFRFANERAANLLGYSRDELIGEHYTIIVDPLYLDKAVHCFSERRASVRASRDDEIWLLCKAGSSTDTERKRIAIELNAMGVYEHEHINAQGKKEVRDFAGTYIVARDITEKLQSQKLIQFQAFHDLLTGLPNRTLFMDRLANAILQARRSNTSLSVMFMDLDRFKVVNDTLGHDVGDELLKQLALRLRDCLRDSDTLARLGGDEFILLLPQTDTTEKAQSLADKIIRTIKAPFFIDQHELYLTASVGIAMYPEDGANPDTLIKNADVAMYHTKGLGKDGFNVYTRQLSVFQEEQLSIESEIRRGIREEQFVVYYQPQVYVDEGRIIGVEALVRWQHPHKGLLKPAYFLSIAEESGLIIELGDWVMESALKEVQRWRQDGLHMNKLAINFSFRQIEQLDFVDKLIRMLKKYDHPGNTFEIEITESTLMNDADKTVEKLKQLHHYGVNIAIDDFGTGYSSLSLLQRLPIDRLKIDRSFIQELRTDSDRSIVEAIAHMAKGLKLDMVAEGVEQVYQLRYLSKLKCPVVQGYIYSQPLPGEELRRLLLNGEMLPVIPPEAVQSL